MGSPTRKPTCGKITNKKLVTTKVFKGSSQPDQACPCPWGNSRGHPGWDGTQLQQFGVIPEITMCLPNMSLSNVSGRESSGALLKGIHKR